MARMGSARWIWLALAVVAADQATKYAVENLTGQDFTRVIIPGLLNLVHRHNPGVAFGLLADAKSPWITALLVVFSGGTMGVLMWMLAAGRAGGRLSQAGLSLILGGAAGNVIDRLIHGSVIDFIDFYLRTQHWPAFNLADSAIVVGAGLVILEIVADWRHRRSAKA